MNPLILVTGGYSVIIFLICKDPLYKMILLFNVDVNVNTYACMLNDKNENVNFKA